MISNRHVPNQTEASVLYWYSLAAGPVIWALHVSVSYMMVGLVCDLGTGLPIYLVTLVALAAVAFAGYYAYGARRQLHAMSEHERYRRWGRDNLLMTSALVSNVIFAVIIVGGGIQVIFWSACMH